ncbi:hypothetical protein [Hasllibacter sp. MH4015]|uniref:hypothetical protein n=1 Tax=Hasllibacter sp. MH4015 TaxID=2854029 RepID=UPI001CD2C237|nr:hypothetical protein [Hasllibacter sp. MH4015]
MKKALYTSALAAILAVVPQLVLADSLTYEFSTTEEAAAALVDFEIETFRTTLSYSDGDEAHATISASYAVDWGDFGDLNVQSDYDVLTDQFGIALSGNATFGGFDLGFDLASSGKFSAELATAVEDGTTDGREFSASISYDSQSDQMSFSVSGKLEF